MAHFLKKKTIFEYIFAFKMPFLHFNYAYISLVFGNLDFLQNLFITLAAGLRKPQDSFRPMCGFEARRAGPF